MDDDTAYNGHGTHVSGIVGAVENDGTGVAGAKYLDSTADGVQRPDCGPGLVIQAKQAASTYWRGERLIGVR
jgi:hypothetical protein